MNKIKTKIIPLSLLPLALLSTISYAEYSLHIPIEKSAISFASKPSDGNSGNESGGNNGNGESGSGNDNETPTIPETPATPETPTEPEPTEPSKTVAESCNEVVTALRSFMVTSGKTSTVALSSTQNAESVGGCPVNVSVTFTDYATYSDLKNFIGSTISYGNSLKVFSKDKAGMKPVELLGLKIINKGNPSHLVYWTGSSYAQESSFSVYFK